MRPLSSSAIAVQNKTMRNLGVIASLPQWPWCSWPSTLTLARCPGCQNALAPAMARSDLVAVTRASTDNPLPEGGSPHERARQSKRGKAASVATLRGDGPACRREPGGGDLRGRSALYAAGRAIWGHRNGPGRERADHLSRPGDHVRAIDGIRSALSRADRASLCAERRQELTSADQIPQ